MQVPYGEGVAKYSGPICRFHLFRLRTYCQPFGESRIIFDWLGSTVQRVGGIPDVRWSRQKLRQYNNSRRPARQPERLKGNLPELLRDEATTPRDFCNRSVTIVRRDACGWWSRVAAYSNSPGRRRTRPGASPRRVRGRSARTRGVGFLSPKRTAGPHLHSRVCCAKPMGGLRETRNGHCALECLAVIGSQDLGGLLPDDRSECGRRLARERRRSGRPGM